MPEEHSRGTDLQLKAVAADEIEEEGSVEGPLSAEQQALVRVIQSSISHSGPLPSPESLAAYERVLVGAAERIVRMAEEQASHRRTMESAVILGNLRAQTLGVWFAFLLAVTGILAGFYLELQGHRLTGFGFFLTSLGVLAGTFVFGRVEQRKERQQKQSPDAD